MRLAGIALILAAALGAAPREIRGKVVTAAGLPVVGAVVRAVDSSGAAHSAETGANGEFRLATPPSGALRLTVEHPLFEPAARELTTGQSADFRLERAWLQPRGLAVLK